jgi:hypothetical protein
MSHKLHIRDNKAEKDQPKILERFSVDAQEIVAAEPERYEIIGRAPETTVGDTTAVLDNDRPSVAARKILTAAGVEQPRPEGESEEVAEEDVHGQKTPAAEAEAKARKKPGPKPKAKPAAEVDETE